MAVTFFTEGGGRIGFGHLSRCQSLADAFREAGVDPIFVVKGDREVSNFLDGEVLLRDWIGDSELFKELLSGAEFVVIDSYLATPRHYRMASRTAKCIFVDDFGRLEYPAPAFVLNGSIYAKEIGYPGKKGIKYLLGPKYAPLRKVFWEVEEKVVRPEIEKILVTFGMSRLKVPILRILKLLHEKLPDAEKCVIVNEFLANKVRSISSEKIKFVENLSAEEMKELMLDCDIAVSGGGQTTYELARTGTPSILVALAENQILNCKAWQKEGLVFVGFGEDKNIVSNIAKSIENIVDYSARAKISAKIRKVVDGQGARRIAKKILR